MFQYFIYKKLIAENIDRLNLGKERECLEIPKKNNKKNDESSCLYMSLFYES